MHRLRVKSAGDVNLTFVSRFSQYPPIAVAAVGTRWPKKLTTEHESEKSTNGMLENIFYWVNDRS